MGSTAKERMEYYCKLPSETQIELKDEILETLTEFLKTRKKEDLEILNKSVQDGRYGMSIFAETFAIFAAYGNHLYSDET